MTDITLDITGTITFTNGSANITGTGTSLIGHLAGDPVLGPDGKWYELGLDPVSNTAAVLDRAYAGVTVTNAVGGTDWVIFKSSVSRDSVRTATKQLTDITSVYRQVMNLTQSDQTARFSKATISDRAGMIIQKAAMDMFQAGMFQDDEFSVRWQLASTWTKALGIDPTKGSVSIYSQLLLGGIISPSQITANTNDYTPTGLDQANIIRLSTDAEHSLTGLGGGAPGRVMALMNVGAQQIDLLSENTGSLAANRFSLGTDFQLAPNAAVLVMYDAVASRWRMVGGSGSATSVYGGTSTTSLVIGTGSKTFSTQPKLSYTVGARLRASSAADPTNFMEGLVTAYSSTNLTVNVTLTGGAGTFADWSFNISGQPGHDATINRFTYTASAGQTSFTSVDSGGHFMTYTPGFIDVYLNGFCLPPSDYTATNGSTVVLGSPVNAGDIVYIVAVSTFNPADALSKLANGTDIADKVGFRANIGILQAVRLLPNNDLNALINDGEFFTADANSINAPVSGYFWYVKVESISVDPTHYFKQTATMSDGTVPVQTYIRTCAAGTFTPWRRLLSADNDLRNFIDGLILSTGGSSATFSIAAGTAMDSTNAYLMATTALSKTTAAWAAGSGVGSLDTGAIAANTWYYPYLIKNVSTGVVDVLISLSTTTPTMPTGYTVNRRIGALLTDGSSNWKKFIQTNDDFLWDTAIADISNLTTLDTTATALTLSVPRLNVLARFQGDFLSSIGANSTLLFSSPLQSAQLSGTPVGNWSLCTSAANAFIANVFEIRTNTSAQIMAIAGQATGNTLYIITRGWIDRRGKDS